MASATYNKKEKWGVSATALFETRSEPGWKNEVEESLMFEFFVFRNPPDMCGIITNDFTARSIYLASTKKILEMAKDFSVTSRFGRCRIVQKRSRNKMSVYHFMSWYAAIAQKEGRSRTRAEKDLSKWSGFQPEQLSDAFDHSVEYMLRIFSKRNKQELRFATIRYIRVREDLPPSVCVSIEQKYPI